MKEISSSITDLGESEFRVDGFSSLGIIVCVVDADSPATSIINTRDFAATHPVCYITISPRVPAGRFLNDNWVCRVSLADILAGLVDLKKVLTDLAAAPPVSVVSKVDIPVYAKGHVLIQPEVKPKPKRVFIVELGDNVVRVNGEVVINPQAGPRLALFKLLWKQFVTDLASQRACSALPVKKLMAAMKAAGYSYGDELSLRKLINNLQSDIETAVKRKLGTPISREDIVETCRMSSQSDASGGYRLNPLSVAIRPFQDQ